MITNPTQKGQTKSILDAAQSYFARGWTIIPTNGKKAVGRWKQFQTTRPDEKALRELFHQKDITGLAVLLGSASGGLVCRDFDDLDSYRRWAAKQVQLAVTLPTVETARGRHVYFRGPERYHDFGDGEYRGDAGHYCLLPPSLHPSGHLYRWAVPLCAGSLPAVDPFQAGFLPRGTEQTELTEQTEQTQQTEDYGSNGVAAGVDNEEIGRAIAATMPTKQGQRNRKLFELCRQLKAIPALAVADFATLRPIVAEWHKRALPTIGTKEFSETLADFVTAWAKTKFPAGQGRIEAALDLAQKSNPPKKAAALYDEPPLILLASLCRELQRIAGTEDFFLDCRTAGRLLGVPHNTAWRWLIVLCADGILRAGAKGNQATHKASRYRYVAD